MPALARKDLLQEVIEAGAMFGGDQQAKAPAQQPGALGSDQARSREVHQLDGAVGREGVIADRREIIEIRIFLQALVDRGLGLLEFLILQLQLDLVNLQLVEDSLGVGFGLDSRPPCRLPAQPVFGTAAQPAGAFRGFGALFYCLDFPGVRTDFGTGLSFAPSGRCRVS